jgi:hypothetical protein
VHPRQPDREVDHEVTDKLAVPFRLGCASIARIFRRAGAERAERATEHELLRHQRGVRSRLTTFVLVWLLRIVGHSLVKNGGVEVGETNSRLQARSST